MDRRGLHGRVAVQPGQTKGRRPPGRLTLRPHETIFLQAVVDEGDDLVERVGRKPLLFGNASHQAVDALDVRRAPKERTRGR